MGEYEFSSLKEFERFEMWAFGVIGDGADIDMMNKWNERHSDLEAFRPEDSMYQSLNKMSRIWVEQGKP